MKAHDILKIGLICTAILVGAKIMGEAFVSRQGKIRNIMHVSLDDLSYFPGVEEASVYVNDVLDITFSISLMENLNEDICDFGYDYIKGIDSFLQSMGYSRLNANERVLLVCVYNIIQDNYKHRVSEDALNVLLSTGVSAKVYHLRSELELCEVE